MEISLEKEKPGVNLAGVMVLVAVIAAFSLTALAEFAAYEKGQHAATPLEVAMAEVEDAYYPTLTRYDEAAPDTLHKGLAMEMTHCLGKYERNDIAHRIKGKAVPPASTIAAHESTCARLILQNATMNDGVEPAQQMREALQGFGAKF